MSTPIHIISIIKKTNLAEVKLQTRLLAVYKQDEAVQKLEVLPKWYVLLSFLPPRAKPCSSAAWGIITAEACHLKSLTSGDKVLWIPAITYESPPAIRR